MIQVLVVDDSAFMRKVISDILDQDTRIRVVATARDGKDALIKLQRFRPDVITLDVEMPVMNGLDTLKKIMAENPCPVVMVSSTTQEGATNTLLAMEYGAVDFIAKPSGAISLDMKKVEEEVVSKVIHAAKANVRRVTPSHRTGLIENNIFIQSKKRKIIAIGTSTGGPKALKDVITKIPATIEAPILIVQHMPAGFTRSLSERLDYLSEINVKEALDGELIENGTAYIAPGGYHMEVDKKGPSLYIKTTLEEPKRGHRPAVDNLFDSLATLSEIDTLAVIMTGMGADGSEGLIKLKQAHSCYAIAEAEESCVVFGMPRAAIKTKLIDEVIHVDNIAARIKIIFKDNM